jgi:hypothetical protein
MKVQTRRGDPFKGHRDDIKEKEVLFDQCLGLNGTKVLLAAAMALSLFCRTRPIESFLNSVRDDAQEEIDISKRESRLF